jgi:hypothetical protein
MKEVVYFSHDGNARNDEKSIAVRMKYQWEGYGLFWALVEKLRESTDYKLSKDYNLIAYDLRVDAGIIKSIVEDFGLFVFTEDGKYFYSERLNNSMNLMNSKSQKARDSVNKRWEKNKKNNKIHERNTNVIPNDTNVIPNDTNVIQIKESKVKESKVKESKVKERVVQQPFMPPSKIDVTAFFVANGFPEALGVKAFDYYSPDWVDSNGKKVKNWKLKMKSVWFTEENKQNSAGNKKSAFSFL